MNEVATRQIRMDLPEKTADSINNNRKKVGSRGMKRNDYIEASINLAAMFTEYSKPNFMPLFLSKHDHKPNIDLLRLCFVNKAAFEREISKLTPPKMKMVHVGDFLTSNDHFSNPWVALAFRDIEMVEGPWNYVLSYFYVILRSETGLFYLSFDYDGKYFDRDSLPPGIEQEPFINLEDAWKRIEKLVGIVMTGP